VPRDDFGPSSEIDVIVVFEPSKIPGFGFFQVQEELSQLFGQAVDPSMPGCSSRYFRDQVVTGAEVQHVAPGRLGSDPARDRRCCEGGCPEEGSVDALRKAHPNYFPGTQVFVRAIEQVNGSSRLGREKLGPQAAGLNHCPPGEVTA
jgi:hypothetical protein